MGLRDGTEKEGAIGSKHAAGNIIALERNCWKRPVAGVKESVVVFADGYLQKGLGSGK